jgi:hypothetical protein
MPDMTISPIGSVAGTAVAPLPGPTATPERPAAVSAGVAAPAATLGATETQQAEGAGYVLYGESGLVIQSYGAIALISPAALLYANAAVSGPQPARPLVAPVERITRIPDERAIDVPA